MKNFSFILFLLLSPIFLMAQTETQQYDVLRQLDEVEVRFYPSVMMAKFTSSGQASSGFRSLFNYISGGNTTNEKIAMTTPVHMEENENGSSMAFVLPKKFSKQNTPTPSRKDVTVYEAAPGHFAAITYSGYTNDKKESVATQKIKAILKANKIKMIGNPRVLSYNSPYKFYNRRNEILIAVDPETF